MLQIGVKYIMFKPLLAATVKDLDTITYPVYASVKLDGVKSYC